MTKEKAVEIARALNDIEDFARFMEEVEKLYHESEGDLAKFYNNQMLPAMECELARRQLVLEQM